MRPRSRAATRRSTLRSGVVFVPAVATLVSVALAGSTSAAPAPVIPWLDKHPVRASVHPPLAPSCRAQDLRAKLFLQGATGSLVGGVRLTNGGRSACSLLGRPQIVFTGAAASSTTWHVKKLARSPEPPDVLADPPGSLRALQPGKSAGVALFWSNWCGARPDGIDIVLANGTDLVIPVAQTPRCDAKQAPSILSVTPFAPTERRLPRSSRLPLRVAIVGARPVLVKPGLRAFRVHRGELLHYRVALTNTGRTRFRFGTSSCPVYLQQLLPSRAEPFVLNCHALGAIPPRQTAQFEMQIRIPASLRLGNNSLTWELAPRTFEAPFAPAAVWVVR
jgi:hypothetical protein